jgi:hypothetical protein
MMRSASDRRLERNRQHLSLGAMAFRLREFSETDMPTHKQDPAQPTPRDGTPQDQQRRVRPPNDANKRLEREGASRDSQDIDPDSPESEVDRDDMLDEP